MSLVKQDPCQLHLQNYGRDSNLESRKTGQVCAYSQKLQETCTRRLGVSQGSRDTVSGVVEKEEEEECATHARVDEADMPPDKGLGGYDTRNV